MIADAYFQCRPEHLDGFRMAVMPDNDVLALDVLNHAKEVYRDSDKIICHVRLGESEITELANQAETMNPLDISAVEAIGITWTYLGRTIDGVFERYPELNSTKIIQTEDKTEEVPIIQPHIWS